MDATRIYHVCDHCIYDEASSRKVPSHRSFHLLRKIPFLYLTWEPSVADRNGSVDLPVLFHSSLRKIKKSKHDQLVKEPLRIRKKEDFTDYICRLVGIFYDTNSRTNLTLRM